MSTSFGDNKNPILMTFKAEPKHLLTGPLTDNFTVTSLSFKNHFSGIDKDFKMSIKSDFYLFI